jgi:hypothetical protein
VLVLKVRNVSLLDVNDFKKKKKRKEKKRKEKKRKEKKERKKIKNEFLFCLVGIFAHIKTICMYVILDHTCQGTPLQNC